MPTEPVEPRMERPFIPSILAPAGGENANGPETGPLAQDEEVIVQDGSAEQQAVEAVEHASMPREHRARVLHPGPALQQARMIKTDREIELLRRAVRVGDIGHRALAVNLSDLASMGASPRLALLSMALPPGSARLSNRAATLTPSP